MARISFKEFSGGLPVTQVNPKAPRVPEMGQQGGTLGRVIKDIPSDIAETFGGFAGAGKEAVGKFTEAFTRPGLSPAQRAAGALVAPFSGLASAAGEVVTGAGKLLTTDEFESTVNAALGEAVQNVADTQIAKNMIASYQALPDDQKYTVSNIIAPIANVMTTVGTGGAGSVAAKRGLGAIKEAFETATKRSVGRTASDAAEAVVTMANPPKAPGSAVAETIKGAATQFKEFGRRTIGEARETAQQSRELAKMPEPRANLIRNGADERVVNVIDQAPPEEMKVYRELVEQAKKKEADPTPNTAQPKVIAGREFLKPVDYIIQQRKGVGSQLGEMRKGLSTSRNIDTNTAFRSFHQYLKDNFGVQFDKDGKIVAGTGTLADTDIPQIQKIYDQLRNDKLNSQVELDQWLQRTYKNYDLVQAREQTFSEEVPRIAEYARSQVRELMPPEYNQLATDYARLSKPIKDLTKLLGYKGDLDKLTAKELKVGEVALRVLGNAADRPQTVIDDVLQAAENAGYRSDIDLNRLIYVTDQLEDLYDITPSRGFSGSATRGINQSTVGAAADVATFNVGGLFDRALSSKATQKEIQQNFENYLKYLDEGGEPGTFKPAQAVKTEQAVQQASEEQVKTEVQKMIGKAPEAKAHIDNIADEVSADIPNVKVAKAPIKSVERAVEKVVNEEGGDTTALKDLARNSLVPLEDGDTLKKIESRMDEVLAKAEADGLYARKKVQTPEKFSGYGGIIYNIETPNGLVGEIQVVEPRMIYGKMNPEDAKNILGEEFFNKIKTETGMEPGYGHKLYEDLRSLSIEELEGPKGKALIQESVDYYNKLR